MRFFHLRELGFDWKLVAFCLLFMLHVTNFSQTRNKFELAVSIPLVKQTKPTELTTLLYQLGKTCFTITEKDGIDVAAVSNLT